MNQKEAIEIMKAFVSGQMSAEDFWEEYKKNEMIQTILNKDEQERNPNSLSWFTAQTLLANIKNIHSYKDSEGLHWVIRRFFLENDLPVDIDNFYTDRYVFLIEIQPSWLDLDDEEFLIKEIVDKIPADIEKKSQKIKWCKDKIKEYFKYDKTPPRWIQSPEWPIANGRPLVFKRQSKEMKDDEQVDFYFYDPDTKQETVITQFY